MALWWIKGTQRSTDEAIEYLLEADSEASANQKAASHGIAVKSVEAYQGSTELSAIRAELAQLKDEVGRLRNGLLRGRNRLRDKPVWTIALGVFFGVCTSVIVCISFVIVALQLVQRIGWITSAQ